MYIAYNDIVIRIMLAVFIGALIGFERTKRNRPAGFRTHILVCVSAAVIAIIQVKIVSDAVIFSMTSEKITVSESNIGRLGASVISGIGFLGAGTILKTKNSVKGLTTAASLWTVACIGLAVGMGYYFISIFSAVVTVVVLVLFEYIENKFMIRPRNIRIYVKLKNSSKFYKNTDEFFHDRGVKINGIEKINETEDYEECILDIQAPSFYSNAIIVEEMMFTGSAISVKIVEG